MKKLISTISALAVIAALAQPFTAVAEDNDLEALAKSLGADTEYISVRNYFYDPTIAATTEYAVTGYDYISFVDPDSDEYALLDRNSVIYADASLGLSALEVVAHNGLIEPADISEGAKKLTDITDTDELRQLISSYQTIKRRYSPLWYSLEFQLKNYSLADKAAALVSTAEEAQKEGKYFLIMYYCLNNTQTDYEIMSGRGAHTEKVHSAVGIGVTDGSWSFGGKTYDKCILTLDSQNVSADSDAFDEKTCIYINSETGDSYSPLYSPLCDGNDLNIVCFGDEKLINYGQAIKPTAEFDTDIDGIEELRVNDLNRSEFVITYNDKDKGEVVLDRDNGYQSCYNHSRTAFDTAPVLRTDGKYIIDCRHIRSYGAQEIDLKSSDREMFIQFGDSDCLTEIEPDHYKLTARYDPDNKWQRGEGVMSYSMHIEDKNDGDVWTMNGFTTTDVEVTMTDEGAIIRGTGGVRARMSYATKDADKEALLENEKKMAEEGRATIEAFAITEGYALLSLTAVRDTLVSVKDDKVTLKIDLDGDGKFEHEVEKGDVNCDGKIDARDASAVLEGYSAESTGERSYIFRDCADYNGDGMVDARDASEILVFYSENSTK